MPLPLNFNFQMKRLTIITLISICILQQVQAQNGVAINTGGAAPDASAVLDVSSTTQGVLVPRMTAAQKVAIPNPATGLLIYQTDGTAGFYYNSGDSGTPVWSALGALLLNDLGDAKTTASDQSVFIGSLAGNGASGTNNVGLGYNSLNTLSTGTGNTAVGAGAGSSTTGSDNILIGKSVLPAASGNSNELNIGEAIYGTNLYSANANIGLGNGNNAPDASALLDMSSITKGLLIPRMTEAERDLIAAGSPATGLMIYQTDGTPGFYYYDGTAWTSATGAKEINDLSDGKADFYDVFLGANAGGNATLGSRNVGIGAFSLQNLSGGRWNVAIGRTAGKTLNAGKDNVFAGFSSGQDATTAESNAFLGCLTGAVVTSGSSNTFIGAYAGYTTTIGSSNIILGDSVVASSLSANNELNIGNAIYGTNILPVTGEAHIGINTNAPNASSALDVTSTTAGILIPRMTQTQRDAIGTPATGLMIYQTDATTGFYYYNGTAWTAVQDGVGAQAINDLTDGKTAATTSLYLGNLAGLSATGVENVGLGYGNLVSLTSGTGNTAVGAAANNALTTGTGNIGIGASVNTSLTTGSDNIVIGRNSTVGAAASNALILGEAIYGTSLYGATAKVGIGNGNSAPTSTLDIGGSVTFDYAAGGAITLDDTHYTYNITAASQNVTLPTAVGISGRVYIIKYSASLGTGTIVPAAGELIDGAGNYVLTAQYKYVQVQSDGANWIIIGQN